MARSQPSSKLSILRICLLVAFLAALADAASLRGTEDEAVVVDENAEDSEDFYQVIIDEPFDEEDQGEPGFYEKYVDPLFHTQEEEAPEDEQLDEERELHVSGYQHSHFGGNGGGYRGGYGGGYRGGYGGGYGYSGGYGGVNTYWEGGGGGGSADAVQRSYFRSSNRAPYSNYNSWAGGGPVRANFGFGGPSVYEAAFYGGPRQNTVYSTNNIRPPAVYSYGNVARARPVNQYGNFASPRGNGVNFLASF